MENYLHSKNNEQEKKDGQHLFRVITKDKVELILNKISQKIGSQVAANIPVEIVGPGDLLFDFQEAQTKLYKKAGGWEQYLELLKKEGFSLPLKFDRQTTNKLRELAERIEVELDGSFEGFAYNLGGMKIMFTDIKESKLLDMANKYAKKEHIDVEFSDTDDAKKFLNMLAEKYLPHEVGHTLYLHIISPELRTKWDTFVMNQPKLIEKVIEIQRDKHPDVNSIPVANEAFADIFAQVVTGDEIPNRLGDQYELLNLMKSILSESGFKVG